MTEREAWLEALEDIADHSDDPASRKIARTALAAAPPAAEEGLWERALADPAFVESLEQGLADVEAGRVIPWSEVAARAGEGLDVEFDEGNRWLIQNDGHGASRIVARDVLPEFGRALATRLREDGR